MKLLFTSNSSKVGKIEEHEKKIDQARIKRTWFSELESLNDKKWCDSVPIPIDIVGDIISKNEIVWSGYYESETEHSFQVSIKESPQKYPQSKIYIW